MFCIAPVLHAVYMSDFINMLWSEIKKKRFLATLLQLLCFGKQHLKWPHTWQHRVNLCEPDCSLDYIALAWNYIWGFPAKLLSNKAHDVPGTQARNYSFSVSFTASSPCTSCTCWCSVDFISVMSGFFILCAKGQSLINDTLCPMMLWALQEHLSL